MPTTGVASPPAGPPWSPSAARSPRRNPRGAAGSSPRPGGRKGSPGQALRAQAIRSEGAVAACQLVHLGRETTGRRDVVPARRARPRCARRGSRPARGPCRPPSSTTSWRDSAISTRPCRAGGLSGNRTARRPRLSAGPVPLAVDQPPRRRRNRSRSGSRMVGRIADGDPALGARGDPRHPAVRRRRARGRLLARRPVRAAAGDLAAGRLREPDRRGADAPTSATWRRPSRRCSAPSTACARVIDRPLLVSQAFRRAESIEAALAAGADLVGVARPLIADPDFPAKLLAGRDRRDPSVRVLQRGLPRVRPGPPVLGQPGSRTVTGAGARPAHGAAALGRGGRGAAASPPHRDRRRGPGRARVRHLDRAASTRSCVFDEARTARRAPDDRHEGAEPLRDGRRCSTTTRARSTARDNVELRLRHGGRTASSSRVRPGRAWPSAARRCCPTLPGIDRALSSSRFIAQRTRSGRRARTLVIVDDGFGWWPCASAVETAHRCRLGEHHGADPGRRRSARGSRPRATSSCWHGCAARRFRSAR